MILGATDVVPHQDMRNPVNAAGDDPDVVAFSDLPYACDTPYSRDVAKFIGPTRVVSRLPDMTGADGPADGNGAADLIAQYFLLKVLEGSSVGMATLAARQEFVAQTGQMDPVDLKTLAQFCVYGDPSIHPVLIATPTGVPKGTHAGVVESLDRRERRAKLALTGRSLQEQKPTAAVPQRRHAISPQVRAVLSGLSREAGVPSASFVAFAVKAKGGARSGKAVTDANRYHVLVARTRQRRGHVVQRVAIVAKEAAKRVVGYRVYFTR